MLYKTILFGKLGIAGLRRKLEVLWEVYFWGAFRIKSASCIHFTIYKIRKAKQVKRELAFKIHDAMGTP